MENANHEEVEQALSKDTDAINFPRRPEFDGEEQALSTDDCANNLPQRPENEIEKEEQTLSTDGNANNLPQRPEINIKRTVLTLEDFPQLVAPKDNISAKDRVKKQGRICRESLRCSRECMRKKAMLWFPFVGVLKQYDLRHWLVMDIVGGLTVGVMHVPQGMGYALLAHLPPIYGLYTSFFPVIVYCFFTTSRHTSFGTYALIALMLGVIVDKEVSYKKTCQICEMT